MKNDTLFPGREQLVAAADIRTSYFSKYSGPDAICIALKHPPSFFGPCYPALFPKWSFLSRYKFDKDQNAYTKAYYDEVLSKLDPVKVLNELRGKTLLCWESSEKFCHRHLVADWLRHKTGATIIEV